MLCILTRVVWLSIFLGGGIYVLGLVVVSAAFVFGALPAPFPEGLGGWMVLGGWGLATVGPIGALLAGVWLGPRAQARDQASDSSVLPGTGSPGVS